MIANCSRCGKEIYIPDRWSLTADDYSSSYCQDCALIIKQEKGEKK